ncbi:hypothetical protein BC831DRAFT_460453 [Entophlyctis helioformis]|nr:hypothetical protein BC831DRAFT_460453 [Entophlyctis helioformis]
MPQFQLQKQQIQQQQQQHLLNGSQSVMGLGTNPATADSIHSAATPSGFSQQAQLRAAQQSRANTSMLNTSTFLGKPSEASLANQLYNVRRELEKTQMDYMTMCKSAKELEGQVQIKTGEIAVIRRNLKKLHSESSELKDQLSKQMVLSEQAKEAAKANLLREIANLKTEIQFKDQEISTLTATARKLRSMPGLQSPAASAPGAGHSSSQRQGTPFPTLSSFNEPIPQPKIGAPAFKKPAVDAAVNTDAVPEPPPRIIVRNVAVPADTDRLFVTDAARVAFGKCVVGHQFWLLRWTAQRRQQQQKQQQQQKGGQAGGELFMQDRLQLTGQDVSAMGGEDQGQDRLVEQFMAAIQLVLADPAQTVTVLLPHLARLLANCLAEQQSECLVALLDILALALGLSSGCRAIALKAADDAMDLMGLLGNLFDVVSAVEVPAWVSRDALGEMQRGVLRVLVTLAFDSDAEGLVRLDDIVTTAGIARLCSPEVSVAVATYAVQLCTQLCKTATFVEDLAAAPFMPFAAGSLPAAPGGTAGADGAAKPNTLAAVVAMGSAGVGATSSAKSVSCIEYLCGLLAPPVEAGMRAGVQTRQLDGLRSAVLGFCAIALEARTANARIFGSTQNLAKFIAYMHRLADEFDAEMQDSGLVDMDATPDSPSKDASVVLDHHQQLVLPLMSWSLPLAPHLAGRLSAYQSDLAVRLAAAVRFVHRLFYQGDTQFAATHTHHLVVASMAVVAQRVYMCSEITELVKDMLSYVVENPDKAIDDVWGTGGVRDDAEMDIGDDGAGGGGIGHPMVA